MMAEKIEVRPEVIQVTLRKLDLKAGDILHVSVGIQDLGDGQGPWIPGPDDIEEAQVFWKEIVGPDVKVATTHFGIVPEVVRAEA